MDHVSIQPSTLAAEYFALTRQYGSPLLLLDCDKLRQQYQTLSAALPGVGLYFAIKSLPHPAVLQTLNALGAGFDIATSGEVSLLSEQNTKPRHTIHTHPIKRDDDIRDALRFGCTTFVIDNPYELEKFIPYRHRVGLLLRLSFPNPDTAIDLSRKFGCKPEHVDELLQQASDMGLHVKGLSFHAGSQCQDASNHVYAIQQCRQIIEAQYKNSGKLLSILDIGGGFPVEYIGDSADTETFCAPIRDCLGKLPDFVQIIAEPGRFLSAPAMASVCTVMGKAQRGDEIWYYLDDGVYGSYSGQIFDHVRYPLTIFSNQAETQKAVLAGPTCDSIDVIAEQINLPPMGIGDLVVGHQMGAYTSATATDFNLFKRARIVVLNSK